MVSLCAGVAGWGVSTHRVICAELRGIRGKAGVGSQPVHANLLLNHCRLGSLLELLLRVSRSASARGCGEETYNRGDVIEFHLTSDRHGLDQELVLAFGIRRGLLLHGLQQHYNNPISSILCASQDGGDSNLGHRQSCRAQHGRSWDGHSSWMKSQYADLQPGRIVEYECHVLLRGGGFDLDGEKEATVSVRVA